MRLSRRASLERGGGTGGGLLGCALAGVAGDVGRARLRLPVSSGRGPIGQPAAQMCKAACGCVELLLRLLLLLLLLLLLPLLWTPRPTTTGTTAGGRSCRGGA